MTREMVRSMRKGSVIVDLEGEGIIETAQYTTISNPYFIEEGIVHVGITNIPAMVPAAANETFTRAIYPMIEDTANYGLKEACKKNFVLRSGIIMVDGKITQKEVADSQKEAQRMPSCPYSAGQCGEEPSLNTPTAQSTFQRQ